MAATGPNIKQMGVVFLVPGTVLLIVLFGRFLPQWFHPGYAVLIAVAILIAFAVRTRRRAHADAGLKPKKGGYSAKLDLLKEKLRARAEKIEAAERFSRELEDLPPAFSEFVEEVRKTAKDVHHRDFVPNLPSVIQEDSDILDALEEIKEGLATTEDVPARRDQISKYVSELRQAATEVDAYANEVRLQGGVFKLAGGQLAGCSLLLLGSFGYGGYLIWQYYSSPRWELWAGLGMIAVALLFAYVLYKMQTEPA